MADKILSIISILLWAGLLAGACRAPVLAQTTEAPAGDTVVQRRCSTVALTSGSTQLPLRLIEPYLQQRADFQASHLVLTEEPESADTVVTLTPSGERDTRIVVSSRITGQHISALSLWTDYPGMIASDVMDKVKLVCAIPTTARSHQPGDGQDGTESMVARDSHGHGFKHVVGRVGFYSGVVLVDAAIVAGYVLAGAAMAASGGPD